MGGQTTVLPGGQSVAVAGQLGDAGPMIRVDSGYNEASTQMPFGFGIRDGVGERGYLLATGFSGSFPIAGVNLFGYNHAPATTADTDGNFQGDIGGSGLLQYASLDVLRTGPVWLPVENVVTKGMRGWCRGIATGTTGGAGVVGIWAGSTGNNAPGIFGSSYHVDASKQVVFRTGVYTAADGTTQIALAECDFVNGPY